MDVTGETTAGWDCPPSETDAGAWSVPNTMTGNSWESIDPPASSHHRNWGSEDQITLKSAEATTPPGSAWDTGPARDRPERTKEHNQTNDLKANFKPRVPVIERPASGWDCSPSETDAGTWSIPNTVAGNSWESIDLPASSHHGNWGSEDQVTLKSVEATTQPGSAWDSEPARYRPARTTGHNQKNDLKANFKPRVPVIERPASELKEVEVPDSAIPHIIGQARRTINALQNLPGITQVMTYIVKGDDQDHDRKTPMQRVKVTGSSMAAINRVITQINRIVLRSATNSNNPEVSVICFPQMNKEEDAISLTLATAEEYQLYLSKHLKAFVVQHAPQDVQEKKYFSYGRKVSSDQRTNNALLVTRKRRRSYGGDGSSYLFGSWDKNLFTSPVSTCLRRFYEVSGQSIRQRPPQMKIRIELGKMFYFGTDLRAPETWNVSFAEMETMTSEQTLRPCFSCFCPTDTVMKARNVLQASGYEQHSLESSQDTVCAELVDMDIPTKPSFNIRFMQRDKIAAKINKKSRRHAYVTFIDEKQRHDLRLRVQTRQKEPVLDEKTRRSVYEGWLMRAGIEDPLISPSGHSYYPMKVLHKEFEYYKKGKTDVVVTRVSPVMAANNHEELQDENADISCRWKISLQQSFFPTWNDDGDVEHIVTRLSELVAEAKKFSEALSSD